METTNYVFWISLFRSPVPGHVTLTLTLNMALTLTLTLDLGHKGPNKRGKGPNKQGKGPNKRAKALTGGERP